MHRHGTIAIALLGVTAAACTTTHLTDKGEQRAMNEPGLVHHEINYIEITVTDMVAAQAFYAAAFGWRFTDYGPEYAGIQRHNGIGEVGGLAQADTPRLGGALVILYSDDLDATLASVESAGGVITTPPFAFPGGRRFHFTDPTGNELAVWAER